MKPARPLPPITEKDEARFWAKVAPANENGCMLWLANPTVSGYGNLRLGSETDGTHGAFLSHRIAYTLANGPIPDGYVIDHACHVRNCVAPAHLRLATEWDNYTNRSGAQTNSRSGIRGVSWHAYTRKWKASGQLRGQSYHLGVFDDIRDAEAAVIAWRREHMPFSALDQVAS